MATPKPAANAAKKSTPARKPAAKRGPTKAAALKALGLTQEDLDTLKAVAKAREGTDAPEILPVDQFNEYEKHEGPDPDWQAPGVPVTERLPDPPQHSQHVEKPVETVFYVRNLRNADVAIRLSRQEKQKKRLELKPRGHRGDVAKLEKEDLDDEQLLQNVGLLVEIITAGEARSVIEKQVVNQQTTVHPSMAMLRNELGKEYAPGALKTEPEFNSQGVVVATLQPQGGEAGNVPSNGRGIDWTAARNVGQTGQVPAAAGNGLVSDGFADANHTAAQADAIARRKDLQGPAAGLGGVQVTLGETQRVV